MTTATLAKGDVIQGGLDEGSKGILISSLISIYKKPHQSIVREYTANAIDARDSVQNNRPVEINLTDFYLSIEDFGSGMDDKTIKNYPFLGASTKRGDTSSTGAFGLGGKSALSTCDAFYAVTRYEGKETLIRIAVKLPARDELQIDVIRVADTDKENGTRVVIPFAAESEENLMTELEVDKDDWIVSNTNKETHSRYYEKEKFELAINALSPFWTPDTVNIYKDGEGNVDLPTSIYSCEQFANGYMAKCSEIGASADDAGIYIKMGHNTYGTGEKVSPHANVMYLVEVPNKYLKTTPNREELIFDTTTESVIENIKQDAKDAAQKEVEEAENTSDFVEMTKAYFAIKRRGIAYNPNLRSDSFFYTRSQFIPGKVSTQEEKLDMIMMNKMYAWRGNKPEKHVAQSNTEYISEECFNPSTNSHKILLVSDRNAAYYARKATRVFEQDDTLRSLIILHDNIDRNDNLIRGNFNVMEEETFLEMHKLSLERAREERNALGMNNARPANAPAYETVYKDDDTGMVMSRNLSVEEISDMTENIVVTNNNWVRDNAKQFNALSEVYGDESYVIISLGSRQKSDAVFKRFQDSNIRWKNDVISEWYEKGDFSDEAKKALSDFRMVYIADENIPRCLYSFILYEADELMSQVGAINNEDVRDFIIAANNAHKSKEKGTNIVWVNNPQHHSYNVSDIEIPEQFKKLIANDHFGKYLLLDRFSSKTDKESLRHIIGYMNMVDNSGSFKS